MSGGSRRKSAPFPTNELITAFIRGAGGRVSKREIARAFHLDADQKVELKRVLKELEAAGDISRGHGRRFREPGSLPSVAVIRIDGVDPDGETIASPLHWEGGTAPVICVAPEARSRSAFAPGERVLARLRRVDANTYEARVIRRLAVPSARALGVFEIIAGQGRILPVNRRARGDLLVLPGESLDARPGDLVWAEVKGHRALGLQRARVVERLGPTNGPHSITAITLHDHAIPVKFPDAALAEAAAAPAAAIETRDDLRAVPLVTIDGDDARDFDDAVWAEQTSDAAVHGAAWHLIVAIADVAWYVRPGSALDRAAFERGNSVYFPDQVVPMLPEPLSNGWCSLRPGEDRPCLAAHLWIDADGQLLQHRFVRAMMRSAARLTYTQVQAAHDGSGVDALQPEVRDVIPTLYGAFSALRRARQRRGVLELDVPERRVRIGSDGRVTGIELRERFDSHRLIEEFMILANVAAAEALEAKRSCCLYRVHDRPSAEKISALSDFLATLGIRLPRGSALHPRVFNRILGRVEGQPEARLVHEVVLRSQAQACYDPVNIGHFGLALPRYAHFTSPIRRYADLIVHRALIAALGLGVGGFGAGAPELAKVGEHVSATERRAAAAERDAIDRFTAAFLVDRIGAEFAARITGVTRFGLFVALDATGADALVPVASLPSDFYVHDEAGHRLTGERSGLTFRLGDPVRVRLVQANPLTGGILCEVLIAAEEAAPDRGRGRVRPRRGPRQPSRRP